MDALKRKMEIAAVAFFCTVTALIAACSCATTAAANLAQQTAAAPATEYVTLAYMEVQPEAEQEPELLYSEYKSFVTKQTTYCNALRQWAKRETDPNVIGSIYYGCALPEDLEKEVGDILSAAQAQITAIINKLSA